MKMTLPFKPHVLALICSAGLIVTAHIHHCHAV
ncbi:hypothetical protein, partial [Escherichia coli]